jgi:hypothetical protein
MLWPTLGSSITFLSTNNTRSTRNTVSNSTEYDVVIATLQAKKDSLWKMTQSNMNADMMNLMDDIRLEQIQELNEAMGMWLLWKEEKHANKTNTQTD